MLWAFDVDLSTVLVTTRVKCVKLLVARKLPLCNVFKRGIVVL